MHAQLSPEPARIQLPRTRSAWRWSLLAAAVPLLPLDLAAQSRAGEAALVRATVVAAAPLAELRVLPASSSAASSDNFPAVYLRLDAPAVVTVGDATLRTTGRRIELRIPAPADGTRTVRIRIET